MIVGQANLGIYSIPSMMLARRLPEFGKQPNKALTSAINGLESILPMRP